MSNEVCPACSSFNMDDFKRCYSNEDEATSIPYFWQKFDPEHYSIWFAEYKYPEELAKVFMSCNLITGACLSHKCELPPKVFYRGTTLGVLKRVSTDTFPGWQSISN